MDQSGCGGESGFHGSGKRLEKRGQERKGRGISRGKASAIIPNPFDLPHLTQLHMYYYPSVICGGLVEDTQVSYIKWSSTFNLPHLLDLKCAHSLPEPSLRIRRGDSV